METHVNHTLMLDPTVGPRILRIAPLLDCDVGAVPDSKCRKLEYLAASRPRAKGAAQNSARAIASEAAGLPKEDDSRKNRLKVKNKKLVAGFPFLGDISVASWNAQSLCCEDPNKF